MINMTYQKTPLFALWQNELFLGDNDHKRYSNNDLIKTAELMLEAGAKITSGPSLSMLDLRMKNNKNCTLSEFLVSYRKKQQIMSVLPDHIKISLNQLRNDQKEEKEAPLNIEKIKKQHRM